MKPHQSITALLLSASLASAQLLTNGIGSLPSCGQSCSVLTAASSSCGSSWSCFCQNVWKNSNHDLTAVCASSCGAGSTDNAAVSTWYTTNCGSDNGVSEHSSGNSGSTNGGGGTNAATTSASIVPTSSASAVSSATGANDQPCASWWDCHWKWVVMIIVLFFGLLTLALVGRWLKKRHDRKQDTIREGFNAGITSRGQPMTTNNAHDSTVMSTSELEPGSGRNTPTRTREAFMPYGYGYARSESRLASHNNQDRSSPLARGSTPINELEKEVGMGGRVETPDSAPKKKSRRVLVREKSAKDAEKELR